MVSFKEVKNNIDLIYACIIIIITIIIIILKGGCQDQRPDVDLHWL